MVESKRVILFETKNLIGMSELIKKYMAIVIYNYRAVDMVINNHQGRLQHFLY